MIRAFIAIPASQELRLRYGQALESWRRAIRGVKWVEPENLHLTVRFLGDIDEGRAKDLRAGVEHALADLKAIHTTMGEPGHFGSASAPRVLWIGSDAGRAELDALGTRIESAVRGAGFPKESQPFSAHWTVARNKQGGRVHGWRHALEKGGISGLGLDVDGVSLLSSTLLPGGPIYTSVWKALLGS